MKDLNFKLNEIEGEALVNHFESIEEVEDDRRTVDFYGQGLKVGKFSCEIPSRSTYSERVPGLLLNVEGRYYFRIPSNPAPTERLYQYLRTPGHTGTVIKNEGFYNEIRIYNGSPAFTTVVEGYYIYTEAEWQ